VALQPELIDKRFSIKLLILQESNIKVKNNINVKS